MQRTNSILAVLHDAENRLHVLDNTIPCGIASIDNETERKRQYLKQFVSDLKTKIERK
jgi:hypothetical protein